MAADIISIDFLVQTNALMFDVDSVVLRLVGWVVDGDVYNGVTVSIVVKMFGILGLNIPHSLISLVFMYKGTHSKQKTIIIVCHFSVFLSSI